MELTLRTPVAFDALRAVRAEVPGMLAGLGTILHPDQVKRAVDEGTSTDLATGLALEVDLFEAVFHTADSRIGVASFLADGPGKAQFTGS